LFNRLKEEGYNDSEVQAFENVKYNEDHAEKVIDRLSQFREYSRGNRTIMLKNILSCIN